MYTLFSICSHSILAKKILTIILLNILDCYDSRLEFLTELITARNWREIVTIMELKILEIIAK